MIDKNFIIELYEKNLRIKKRKTKDSFRDIKIEYDISVNAEGSATVTMGDTKVMAGVKLNVGTPYPDAPDEGTMIVTAEFIPLADPEFESGPPGKDAVELARIVDRGIRESKAIDMKKMCIVKGEAVWIAFIDIYILNNDGNLIDAAALAAISALSKTVFPKLDKENKVLYGEFTNKKIPFVKKPITCTFAKIGDIMLLDPSKEEEITTDARISIATHKGMVHAIQKGGNNSFTEQEIIKCVKIAVKEEEKISKLFK